MVGEESLLTQPPLDHLNNAPSSAQDTVGCTYSLHWIVTVLTLLHASPTSFLSLILHCEMHDALQLAGTPFHAVPENQDSDSVMSLRVFTFC